MYAKNCFLLWLIFGKCLILSYTPSWTWSYVEVFQDKGAPGGPGSV